MYNAEITNEGGGTLPWYRNSYMYHIEFVYFGSKGRIKRTVTGTATRNTTDKYNEEVGKNLAKTKAYEAYHHEVKKLMIAETDRPEWKKKQKMSFEGKTAHIYGMKGFEVTKDINRIGKEMAKKCGKGKSVKGTVEEI